MEVIINGHTLVLMQGDITTVEADAIVNAANSRLAGGGGVDGAIHRAGGPEIMAECRRIGGCPTGSAVATTAGRLRARHVIHAVAPRWTGGSRGEPELLASAYRRSLELADELGDHSVAFPSLGTGAYGYPVDQAAQIALRTVIDYLRNDTQIARVTFVLFTDADLQAYERALEALLGSEHEGKPELAP
jgi:O-acetyl-ADP-ribose deacetylase (regulator of RNase III)